MFNLKKILAAIAAGFVGFMICGELIVIGQIITAIVVIEWVRESERKASYGVELTLKEFDEMMGW